MLKSDHTQDISVGRIPKSKLCLIIKNMGEMGQEKRKDHWIRLEFLPDIFVVPYINSFWLQVVAAAIAGQNGVRTTEFGFSDWCR